MIGIDAIVALGSLIVPPAFDFVKKKFIGVEEDTPERTISSLATTNPEVIPQYIEGQVKLKEATIKFFNRDVLGTPSQWVIDLRASIRPVVVVFSFILFFLNGFGFYTLADGVRLFCISAVNSWMGSRLVKK